MKHAYLMIGLPGSGKSTVVKELAAKAEAAGKTFGVFSLDLARLGFFKNTGVACGTWTEGEIYRQAFEFANENTKAFDEYVRWFWEHVRSKYDCVAIDNTHMTRKSRTRWIQDLRSSKNGGPWHITGINVMVPVELAIQRQSTRGDKYVPAQVIRDMSARFQELYVPDEVDLLLNMYGF